MTKDISKADMARPLNFLKGEVSIDIIFTPAVPKIRSRHVNSYENSYVKSFGKWLHMQISLNLLFQ